MNIVFFSLIIAAFLFYGGRELLWRPEMGDITPMAALTKAMVDSAAGAVDLALGLVGVMTLFLGLMKVVEAGGMLTILSRLIRPLMIRLFPEVPADHPAMGAMILNLSANILGLGNAATPFGIRAMQELETLNPHRGTATNAMALFLAINTSSITLLPTGVIALRAAAGSTNPAGILSTTLFASTCGTVIAILSAMLLARFFPLPTGNPSSENTAPPASEKAPEQITGLETDTAAGYPAWVGILTLFGIIGVIPLTVLYGKALSPWILPSLMMGFLLFGFLRKVRVYEVFVEGAKEGFQVALKIIPYLVAILVAVGMFRASGGMDLVVGQLGVWTEKIGLPAEALPMALMRSLSGSGAYGIMAAILNNPAIGPDSYTGYLVSTLQGSSETTFYVLAVYFGAIQVRRVRHTLVAALIADVAAVLFSVIACRYMVG